MTSNLILIKTHLWCAGVREYPPWCSIVGDTVTVHQFCRILHFCHTCSLSRVKLVVQFPARGSTQMLLCLFPGMLWLWHFTSYIVSVHIKCQASIYTLSLCRGHSWRVSLAQQETLTIPGAHGFQGPWRSTVVLYCWCHSDSASVLSYFTYWSSVLGVCFSTWALWVRNTLWKICFSFKMFSTFAFLAVRLSPYMTFNHSNRCIE